MKDNNLTEVSKKTKDEVKVIKEDIQDLLKRLKDLKGDAVKTLFEDSEELMSTMGDMKDKMLNQGQGTMRAMCRCIENNPMKSAWYFFGAGIILTMLIKR